MFLLLPVGSDSRQPPLFTAALVALNMLVFASTWPKQDDGRTVASAQVLQLAGEMKKILADPESSLKEPEKAILLREPTDGLPSKDLREVFARVQSDAYAISPKGRYRWDLVYPVFESSERSLRDAPDATTPFLSWGLGSERRWVTFLTHQFLHGGWVHLGFNMLFLWVVGSALESVLGLWLLAVYLAGGIAAGAAQLSWGLAAGDVLVGASGSISALMGFALALQPQAKIKLFYLLLITLLPRFGVFDAPLWFFMPVWAFQQILMLLMTAKSAVQQVAYMAHVGGFAAGLAAAIVLRVFSPARSSDFSPNKSPTY